MVTPIIYRPVEQLLARTIAERRARDQAIGDSAAHRRADPARARRCCSPSLALVFREPLQDDLFGGNDDALLDHVLVGARVRGRATSAAGCWPATSASGSTDCWCSSSRPSRFCSRSRCSSGWRRARTSIAIGILAGPVISLFVVPLALMGRRRADHDADDGRRAPRPRQARRRSREGKRASTRPPAATAPRRPSSRLSEGGGFALAALVIMACEQTIPERGAADRFRARRRPAAAAVVINIAAVIARAPMQLFQSVATSLLPHLFEAADDRRLHDLPAQRAGDVAGDRRLAAGSASS